MDSQENPIRIPHSAPELLQPHPKRQKVSSNYAEPPMFTTHTPPPEADYNMLMTMADHEFQEPTVAQSLTHVNTTRSCPCRHLHGPGQGTIHDCFAVGLTDRPLFRGPWKISTSPHSRWAAITTKFGPLSRRRKILRGESRTPRGQSNYGLHQKARSLLVNNLMSMAEHIPLCGNRALS